MIIAFRHIAGKIREARASIMNLESISKAHDCAQSQSSGCVLSHFLSFSLARASIDLNRDSGIRNENAQRPAMGLIKQNYRSRNHECRDRTLTFPPSAQIFH